MTLRKGIRDVFDWPLFVMVMMICTVGIVNLYSATSARPDQLRELYITQIYWLTLGSVVAVVVAAIDYRHYERYGWVGYAVGVVLLVLVFLLGPAVRGSQRWIPIGGFSLQPSETMKICFIVAIAKHLHDERRIEGRTLKDLVVPGLILALPMGLILAQPDLGTALIIAAIFGSVMALTHLKLRSLMTLVISFVISAPLAWTFVLKDYQRDRVVTFLAPEADIQGKGWHAYQAKVAIGSGGVTGKGFMQGTQNQHRFLPDQYSDFPFSVWSEEHGLIGAVFLVLLYGALVLWGLRIASQAKDRFGAVVAVGVSALIFWQTVINVGMVCGLLPVVGITLPLFSYGGSSVLTVMMGIGLLMNVSMRRFTY